jgi:hypothetical protein
MEAANRVDDQQQCVTCQNVRAIQPVFADVVRPQQDRRYGIESTA